MSEEIQPISNIPDANSSAIVPGSRKDITMSGDPHGALMRAIERSPSLNNFIEKIGTEAVVEIILSLGVFAPYEELTSSELLQASQIPERLLFLDDGTYIKGCFDFPAFNFVCSDSKLSDGESKKLYEALKETPILRPVYKRSKPLPQVTDGTIISFNSTDEGAYAIVSPVIWEDQTAIEDTGRVAIHPLVQKVLKSYLENEDNEE